jgi:zinc/manganese transport system permease protein
MIALHWLHWLHWLHVVSSPSTRLPSALQPFSWNLVADVEQMLHYDFMRNALLAGTAVALAAGLVGYFVVLRHLVFAGEALSHVAFAGAMGAALLGLNPFVGLFGVTTLGALGLNALGARAQPRGRDVATGIVLAWVLGLGALFLGIYISSATTSSNIAIGVGVLFGSILGVSAGQALLLALAGAATSLIMVAIARPLLFASVDPDVARARGLPAWLLGAVFLVLLAVTVAEAVPAVGALLVFALLLTPAATARLLLRRPYAALFFSAALALAFTWIGLFVAFYTPYPVSFLISALAFICYLAALGARQLRRLVARRTGAGETLALHAVSSGQIA